MNLAVKATQSPQTLPQTKAAAKPANLSQEVKTATETPKDSISLASSLKGAGAGALGVGGTTIAIFAATGGFKEYGALVSVPLSAAAAVGGAVGGAVAANVATSKSHGALVGAASGALVGATTLGLISKDIGSVLIGAAVGGITGAAGGFFGAMVSDK